MASPAQVANDLSARAKFWQGRDDQVERACRWGAAMIRDWLAGIAPGPQEYSRVHAALLACAGKYRNEVAGDVGASLTRGRWVLEKLARGDRSDV